MNIIDSNTTYQESDPEHFILEELSYENDNDNATTRWQILMEFAMSRADTVKFSAPIYRKIVNRNLDQVHFGQLATNLILDKLNSAENSNSSVEQHQLDITTNTSNKTLQWQENCWCIPKAISQFLKTSFIKDDGTHCFLFHLAPEIQEFLRNCESLTSWGIANNFPEDPAFYRKDQLILWTISHENMVYYSTKEGFPSQQEDASVD